MLIACPNCATSYQIDSASLGSGGRSVRCARCQNVWFAANTEAMAAIAEAHRAEMARFAVAIPAGEIEAEAATDEPQAFPAEPPPDDALGRDDEAAGLPAFARLPEDDASFAPPVTIIDAPALAPIEQGLATDGETGTSANIETVAARRRRAKPKRGYRLPLPGMTTGILTLLMLNIGLIAWRTDIVRWAPQTASLYAAIGLPVNVRGLTFVDVKSDTQTRDGVQILAIEGNIVSMATRVVEVPRLRFSVRNANGNEIYTWTALPSRSMLAPGETLTFRSRLASPPPEARDVLVRFFNRRDLAATIH